MTSDSSRSDQTVGNNNTQDNSNRERGGDTGGEQNGGARGDNRGERGAGGNDGKSDSEGKGRENPLKSKLPQWMLTALKDSRKWKTFLRVMVVFFVNMIYLMDQKTLDAMGQAGFFGLILCCILPPQFPLSIFLYVISTIVFGMLLGWAWGVAAMAAALRIRDAGVTQQQLAGVYAAGGAGTNIQVAIFHGSFLQPASTGIYALFFFIGVYSLGSVRAIAPKLTPAIIFATIVCDVMFSYGPLFPTQDYTLATTFLIPSAFYIATALVATVLIFPQTVNHSLLSGYTDGFIHLTSTLFGIQTKLLSLPYDNPTARQLAETTASLKKGLVLAISGLEGGLGMLELEVSRGRTGAADIKVLVAKGKILTGRLIGLSSVRIIFDEHQDRIKEVTAEQEQNSDALEKTSASIGKLRQSDPVSYRMRRDLLTREARSEQSLNHLTPILEKSSSDLRKFCTANLENAQTRLGEWNHSRWNKAKEPMDRKKLEKDLATLKDEIAKYRQTQHTDLLKPFKGLFDDETGRILHKQDSNGGNFMLGSLFLCFVYSTNLIGFAEALQGLMETIIDIDQRNPKSKFQWPSRIVSKAQEVLASQDTDNPLEMGGDNNEKENHEDYDRKLRETARRRRKMDPDADPPRNGVQRFTNKLSAVWRWQTSPQGIFALRYSTVSMLLWIPAILPSSAWFNYENKGLWALIMSQTGLGVFSGEQIVAFLQRCAGTMVGLVLGMLSWYLGSGNAYDGNAYGVIAATVVITAPFLYMRMISPQQVMPFFLMTAVTIVFTVGYSWINSHLTVIGNTGVGYALAWKRALLVLIGFTSAFLISLFPQPLTAKKSVRNGLSNVITGLEDLYQEEISDLLEEARASSFGPKGDFDINQRASNHRTHFLKIAEKLNGLEPQLGMAAFEPSMKGPWPKAKYRQLSDHCVALLSVLGQLNAAWTRLDPAWAKRLVDQSPFLAPAFISDTLAELSLIRHALRNGTALPPTMRLQERLAQAIRARKPMQAREEKLSPDSDSDSASSATAGLESELGYELTWDSIQNEQTAIYATCTVALGRITILIDRLLEDVKSLVGENEFQQLRDLEHERAEREYLLSDMA